MPTYDYRCEECGYEFERFQPITAKAVRECPKCGRRAVKRLIGAGAAVLFRGTGFYATDYRSKGYKEAAQKESPTGQKKEKTSAEAGGGKKPSE